MYTAFVLNQASRSKLAAMFPPKYGTFIGHHVTMDFGVPKGTCAPDDANVKVIGYKDSGDGIEALVVTVNGSAHRPDGKLYHVTWSIDPKSMYKPKDSNTLLAGHEFTLLPDPVVVFTTPKVCY